MKMDKSVQITLIIVLGVLVLGLLLVSNFSTAKNTVTGNGYAEIKVIPDLVKVYLNIETKADNLTEAKDKNFEIFDNLVSGLESKGFAKEDVKTQSFSVTPNYVWSSGRNTISGYVATHSIVVEMSADEISKLSDVIDATTSSGTSVSYISFELSQEKEKDYKSEAIKLASEDARLKATALAEGLGKNLGSLVSVSDSSFSYAPWVAYQASEGDSVTSIKESVSGITPTEQTVSSNVMAVFKLR